MSVKLSFPRRMKLHSWILSGLADGSINDTVSYEVAAEMATKALGFLVSNNIIRGVATECEDIRWRGARPGVGASAVELAQLSEEVRQLSDRMDAYEEFLSGIQEVDELIKTARSTMAEVQSTLDAMRLAAKHQQSAA